MSRQKLLLELHRSVQNMEEQLSAAPPADPHEIRVMDTLRELNYAVAEKLAAYPSTTAPQRSSAA